jgi:hypothetical protein
VVLVVVGWCGGGDPIPHWCAPVRPRLWGLGTLRAVEIRQTATTGPVRLGRSTKLTQLGNPVPFLESVSRD